MTERRVDHLTRKRIAEMSPEEMRIALLVSERTGLPNRRAFEEGAASSSVAMSDVNGLKALNDQYGYSAGDILIRRFAEVLTGVGLDAYHNQGDEFLCKGESYQELNLKLTEAQHRLRREPFAVCGLDGRIATIEGADFCFGIGTNLEEAEISLRHQKGSEDWRLSWKSPGHGYRRAAYGLKVPFPPARSTATLVLEQTSGEGCFDRRPRNSNECWGVLFCWPMQSRGVLVSAARLEFRFPHPLLRVLVESGIFRGALVQSSLRL